ncbi:MAG: primosomal replication protein N [Proteobacteria bacterium]|nr:primosomal replication protein N [Pseudomonadota bacterium]
MPDSNRLTLAATLASREPLRYTPAGIPALDVMLVHASMQPEAGGERQVNCELAAVAFGDVAVAMAKLPQGAAIRVQGFIARRYRTGTSLALHVNRFETME